MAHCKFDWGLEGLQEALTQEDIVVIVDTFRFSSAVVTALAHGVVIFSTPDRAEGQRLARQKGAILSSSISPRNFLNAKPGTKVVLVSLNGAACAKAAAQSAYAFIGCLLNAKAVGGHVRKLAAHRGRDIAVIAAGELTSGLDSKALPRRLFALEDYLSAGAIIQTITQEEKIGLTPEAQVCLEAYKACKKDLKKLLNACVVGKWLIAQGLIEDVRFAAQLNKYTVVPQVRGGRIELARPPESERK